MASPKPKAPSPNTSQWGLGFQYMNLRGEAIQYLALYIIWSSFMNLGTRFYIYLN